MSSAEYHAFRTVPLSPAEEKAAPSAPWLTNPAKYVDLLLAGLGLWLTISLIGLLEIVVPFVVPGIVVPLYSTPMLASGIIFFAGPAPPGPKSFLMGTLGSASVIFAVLHVLGMVFPAQGTTAQGAVAGMLLMWYKGSGTMFPPVVALAGLLLAKETAGGLPALQIATFLLSPWLSGHALLYGGAYATSLVRARARVALARQRFAALKDRTDGELRAIFDKFETSGDGTLDAAELKVAMRVAVGVDLAVAECEELVAVADTNGTGTVEFFEFVAICRQQI